jgi:hypothetical protein
MEKAEFPCPSGVMTERMLGRVLRGGLGMHQVPMQEKTLGAHIFAPRVLRTGQCEEQREKDRDREDYGPPLPFTWVADALDEPSTGQPNSRRIMMSS